MEPTRQTRLIQFLQEDLAVSAAAIGIVLRHREYSFNLLPVMLWQYGLITTEQLDRIFDWLETASPLPC
jgi:hypothetical protein